MMEKLQKIKELNRWYDEFDRQFPEWYRKIRLNARKIYEEYERKSAPICKYGKDFEFTNYMPNISPEHEKLKSLLDLDNISKQYVQTVGMIPEEKDRAGSHLQEDTTVTYTTKADGGVVAMNPDVAILKYPWLNEFVHRLVPVGLDKYTALCTAYSIGGVFLWIKEGTIADVPIQACFLMEIENLAQLPYIVIIVEPYAKVNIISGCVMNPGCTMGVHGCVTEIYIGKGSEVTFNIIHNFKPGYHVRPKVGVMVEEDATYIENYIEVGEPESSQLYPTVILRGNNSRASLRSLFFGKGNADFDIGSAIVFTGENTRGEIVSRTVVLDESTVRLRGSLKAFAPTARGHMECRALLLSDKAKAIAYPTLKSLSPEASLTHEAAVGKIAEEQLFYLMSKGLSKEEAVSTIVRGFLDIEIPGIPHSLQAFMSGLISKTTKEVM
jgi:Fe-S cluster assembly scaffold protein SufB